MQHTLQNNTVIVVVNNHTTELNLMQLDKLTIDYAKEKGEVRINEVKSKETILKICKPTTSTFKDLLNCINPAPSVTSVTPLTYDMLIANGWTPEQIAASEEYSYLVPKNVDDLPSNSSLNTSIKEEHQNGVKNRGKISKKEDDTRIFKGRKPHKKDMNTLKRQNNSSVAIAYNRYLNGDGAVTIVNALNKVNVRTFYTWCSILTRLLANKTVEGKHLQLRTIAKIIAKQTT